MDRDLTDKIALVTGAGGGDRGGIGAGIARALAARGARVAVNDVSRDSCIATVSGLAQAGHDAQAFPADISDSTEVANLVSDVIAHYAGIDILVNNAGVVGTHTAAATPDEEWHRVLEVNLSGPFYACRAALPYLQASAQGRIVFISSIAGIRVGTLGGASYTASKAGLLGLMRHLAAEFAQYGITVNAVLPGMVMTPLVERRTNLTSKAELFAAVPAGRGARPDEIGDAVAFLASSRAAYINGAGLVIDGGRTVLPGNFASWALAAGLDTESDEVTGVQPLVEGRQ